MTKQINFTSIEIDGINTNDYPDFCDAYISYAEYTDGSELNDSELDELSDDGQLVHEKVMEFLY